MAIGEIKEKFFLSPREAVALIGPESFGPDWKPDLPYDDPIMKAALRNLYAALQSGTVDAYHHDFDGFERPLAPVEAANDFFKIDLKRNCCFFGPSPPRELKISRAALKAFLEAVRKAQEPEIIDNLEQCTRWLIDRLQAPGRRP